MPGTFHIVPRKITRFCCSGYPDPSHSDRPELYTRRQTQESSRSCSSQECTILRCWKVLVLIGGLKLVVVNMTKVSDIRPAPRLGSTSETSTRLQASATTAADHFNMQVTWNADVQINSMVRPLVVAGREGVAMITRRAKTMSHWTRQRQLKRDSVLHLFRRDEQR